MSFQESGFSVRNYLEVTVLRYEFPDVKDFWDGNWVRVRVVIQDEHSRVAFENACLRTDEVRRLRDGLQRVLAGKCGTVLLAPRESWWDVGVAKSDEYGHFILRLSARFLRDRDRCSVSHAYEFEIDQTDLRSLENQLSRTLQEYPVIGEP
jgi:hypothetical protein